LTDRRHALKKILKQQFGIQIQAFLSQLGPIKLAVKDLSQALMRIAFTLTQTGHPELEKNTWTALRRERRFLVGGKNHMICHKRHAWFRCAGLFDRLDCQNIAKSDYEHSTP